MPKSKRTQLSPDLEKRMSELEEVALNELARRGMLHFRMDVDDTLRLYKIAARNRKHVDDMIREWVLERLQEEESETTGVSVEERLTRIENVLAMFVNQKSAHEIAEVLQHEAELHGLKHE
ncbi:MAG TPA: hypothetical protein V6D17_07415 [Candidatus Obscuribacterales bacterium]